MNKLFNHAYNIAPYIRDEINSIISFCNKSVSTKKEYRWRIEDFVVANEDQIEVLDFSKYYNSIFVLTLLDYAEEFDLVSVYRILYNIALNNNLNVGHRHQAIELYLIRTEFRKDYIELFSAIITKLQYAYENEEDSIDPILKTYFNYLKNAIRSCFEVEPEIINALINKTKQAVGKYSILQNSLIKELLSSEFFTEEEWISKLLELTKQVIPKKTETKQSVDYIIESNTKYAEYLKKKNADFCSIRSISRVLFNTLNEVAKHQIGNQLRRGVKIIDSESQLLAYMTYYGNKHHKKLIKAFGNLFNLPPKFNLIDWACGQGLASMVFMDKYGSNAIEKVILNEPSELALKRASLHISHYSNNKSIVTINKDFSELSVQDLTPNNNNENIHLFSNILDIDLNLEHLSSLVEKTFTGENYFVISSPYIKDLNTNRIDMFVDYFESTYGEKFTPIYTYNQDYGDPTMVLRLFKVFIN